jgi:hypothetical protein
VTDRQYNGQYICDSQNKQEKRTNIIYKTLHRKLKIEQLGDVTASMLTSSQAHVTSHHEIAE